MESCRSFYSPSGYYFQEHWEGADKVLALPLDYHRIAVNFWIGLDPIMYFGCAMIFGRRFIEL